VCLSLLATAVLVASPPQPPTDLLGDLTVAIVRALGTDQEVNVLGGDDTLVRDVGRRLAERSVRVQPHSAPNATVVAVTCSDTLADRICAAEIRRPAGREFVSVRRPHEAATPSGVAAPMVLQLPPLIADAEPILDVALVGSQLLVLQPSAVKRYDQTSDGWRLRDARPIASARPWPRDIRGRILTRGSKTEMSLPGMSCSAPLDSFELTCVEVHEASGKPLAADHVAADDVTTITTPCAAGTHVILPIQSSAADEGSTLRLFRVDGLRRLAATPPIALPGTITALWSNDGVARATVVSYDAATGLYGAFQIGVSCNR